MKKSPVDILMKRYLRMHSQNDKLGPPTPEGALNFVYQNMNPEMLKAWLWLAREPILRQRFTSALQAQKRATRKTAAAAFADSLGERGPTDQMVDSLREKAYGTWHTVDRGGEKVIVRAGEMVAADHQALADDYERRGNRLKLIAEFHRGIAKRLGDRTVEESFDPREYLRLMAEVEAARESFSGDPTGEYE